MKGPKCPDQRNYNIGDIVYVKEIIYFHTGKEDINNSKSPGIRKEYKKKVHKHAYYVGYTFKSTGKVVTYSNIENDEYYETVFEPTLVFGVARIRFTKRGKEFYALFCDIDPTDKTQIQQRMS